jgi:ribonucleotide monophosphatase NagD (HAD superfamily)
MFYMANHHLKYLNMQVNINFNLVEDNIIQMYPNRTFTNFYMIGDNPEVDIRGANLTGFESVLVKYVLNMLY